MHLELNVKDLTPQKQQELESQLDIGKAPQDFENYRTRIKALSLEDFNPNAQAALRAVGQGDFYSPDLHNLHKVIVAS